MLKLNYLITNNNSNYHYMPKKTGTIELYLLK